MSPALALLDMERDRKVERLAHRSGVPLLRNLEGYTGRLAEGATGARARQSLERNRVLEEMSALAYYSPPVGVRSFRAGRRQSRSRSASWA